MIQNSIIYGRLDDFTLHPLLPLFLLTVKRFIGRSHEELGARDGCRLRHSFQ